MEDSIEVEPAEGIKEDDTSNNDDIGELKKESDDVESPQEFQSELNNNEPLLFEQYPQTRSNQLLPVQAESNVEQSLED